MNILITGSGGFIGQNVVRQLLKQKKYRLRLLLMDYEKDLANEFPGADTVIGTLTDSQTIKTAVSKIDIIIHLASKNIDNDGTGFQTVNVDETRLLCKSAEEAGVKKILYLSTVGVYGHARHRDADEETPVRPDTDFSRSKADAESIILKYNNSTKLQGVILRHRFVYGKGDQHVLKRMIKAAAKYPFLISRGRAKISFIHVNDLTVVISALLNLKLPLDPNPVYHVTDGQPVRYRDMIHLFCDTYGFQRPKLSIPLWLIYFPVRLKELLLRIDPEVTKSSVSSMRLKLVGLDNYFSNKKLSRLLPDIKFTAFRDGFGSLADYYREK